MASTHSAHRKTAVLGATPAAGMETLAVRPAVPAPDAPPSFLDQPARAPAEPPVAGERNSLQLYLQEIGKTPLLTIAEEVELARRIRRGDKSARDHMIKANLRLVVKIAHDYKDFGLPLLDLISEGNIGLIKAVERFDPRKGGKLSTYAAWWIKQSIKRALANQSKTIRLPVHLVDKISKMRRTAMALAEEFGREPSDEEIAMELGIPTNKVAHLKSVSVRPASLDAPLGDESDSATFGDIVGDDNAVNPYENSQTRIAPSAPFPPATAADPLITVPPPPPDPSPIPAPPARALARPTPPPPQSVEPPLPLTARVADSTIPGVVGPPAPFTSPFVLR